MLFEIINPSDAYTFSADDLEVAAIVGIVLGEGKYPIEQIDGEWEMPFLAFGGSAEWWQKQFGKTIDESLTARLKTADVAVALDSVLIGNASDRELFESATQKMQPADAEKYRADWHEKKRSSLNDIGGYAQKMATRIKKEIAV